VRTQVNFLKLLPFILLIECGSVFAQVSAKQPVDPALTELGKGFVSATVQVNGTTLHYVRGGSGPAVILLHGFPQDWSSYRKTMPRLAKNFTVIAVDLRGIGGSRATIDGYDAANLAEDIRQLAEQLKLKRVYIVGHDVGGWVAYAFARRYPQMARGVMILEVPLPGLKPSEELKANPQLWHMGFHQTPDLPEKLLAGRQFIYFRDHYFSFKGVKNKAISDSDVTHYANSYSAPEQLRAGMEFYRAFPANEKFNAAQRNKVEVPFVLVGGEHSFANLLPKVAEDMRTHGCGSVTIEIIKNAAHYLVDEQPETVSELIERYAALSKSEN
jgi:pimeloyl-ACP methyl ester carboxylesterase